MQRILGLSQSDNLKDGKNPIIRNVIFPQPLTHFTDAPMSQFCKEPDFNMPKYVMESAGLGRLLALNHTNRKWSHTFLSTTESVGLDTDLTCEDPYSALYLHGHGKAENSGSHHRH